MDLLKKSLAPITDDAWEEINTQSEKIIKNNQVARRVADINGPNGINYGGISSGRLITPKNQPKEGINYGIREILPLVEIRKPFELNLWELDNASRGAKDIDLEPLEKAAKQMVLFEEKAIYEGFSEGQIKGFEMSANHPKVVLPDNPDEYLQIIGSQITELQKEGVDGPYALIMNDEKWKNMFSLSKGYPIINQLKQIVGENIYVSHGTKNSFIVSKRGGDFELILGQDISIGYDVHTTEKVKLYFSESFTFRVLSPEALRILSFME